METIKRVVSAAALLIGAACARRAGQPSAPPVAQPSAPAIATGVPASDVDTVVLINGSDVYRWNSAQRDSAMAVLVVNRAKWAAYRPRTYEYWEHGWCFRFSMLRSGPRGLVIRNERLVSATDTSGRTTDSAYMKAVRGRPAGIDALLLNWPPAFAIRLSPKFACPTMPRAGTPWRSPTTAGSWSPTMSST